MTGFQTRFIAIILYLFLPFLISTDLLAQTYTLDKVADINTPIPMGVGNFTDFREIVSIGGSDIGFRGIGLPGETGIYTSIDNTVSLVVDENTAIPMGTGDFFAFFAPISLGGANFSFVGFNTMLQEGIYTANGVLTKIADENTIVPMGTETFTNVGDPVSIGAGDVAFLGLIFTPEIPEGVYKTTGGVLSKVADRNTAAPMGGSNFISFDISPNIVSVGGGNVAFSALSFGGGQGLYASNGATLLRIADENTMVPVAGGFFELFEELISIGDGDVAFVADDGDQLEGIYSFVDGTLDRIVDTSIAVPMGTGNFTAFSMPAYLGSGSDIAFLGTQAQGPGVYTSINNVLSKVADPNTAIPMGAGNFSAFNGLISLGAGDVAFSTPDPGIYALVNGVLGKVVDTSTSIPMGIGNFTDVSDPISLGGGDIAFKGSGSGNQEGIYRAFLSSITIEKQSIPGGITGFEFVGTGFSSTCNLDGSFILNDNDQIECGLPAGSYIVQETNSQGLILTDITCIGASSFVVTGNTVTINLGFNEDVVCTFINQGAMESVADLSVVKTGDPDPILVGEQLTYSFTIENMGPDTAPAAMLTDVLPASVTFVSASAGCVNTNGTVVCDLGNIANGGMATVSIVVTPNQAGEITNTTTVASDAADDDPTNSTSTITTQVNASDVFLTVIPQAGDITTEPGGNVTMSVDVRNPAIIQTNDSAQTRETAMGVIFTVNLPQGFDLQLLQTSSGTCSIQTLSCSLGDIAPGQTVTVTLNAIAPQEDGAFNVNFSVFVNTTGQMFNGNATVRVESGGGGGDGSGGCAIAGPNRSSSSLLGLLLYAVIPAAILIRRRQRLQSCL